MLNKIAKAELEKLDKDKSLCKETFDASKRFMLMRLTGKVGYFRVIKQAIEQLETVEEEAYLASLTIPPPERAEQIQRAEALLSGRLFKTIGLALALKGLESRK